MKPVLGTFTDPPGQARVDLPRLLETKLLLQAGSGFGKSWALRRILEQTHDGCQQFVIDPEGEFATLRERHGYVLAAVNGGDVVAHPRTAGLLARRLVEMKVSAVLDISELKKPERRRFVRLFLEELMGLPRAMWTPLMVAIDEIPEFAPEKDEAESLAAVIDLATRGRKRGYSMIGATQRIERLSKDVAAELHNKLIGFTSLDLGVKRAAFELGMTPAHALTELRKLEPGDFFAIGPAITPTIRRMRIGDVETTHPRPGTRKLQAPPKPTAEIIAVLPKLADLPKEAEQEQKTLDDLRRELANTKRELTIARKASPAPSTKGDSAALREASATIARLERVLEEVMKFIVQINAREFVAKAGESVDAAALEKAIASAVSHAMKAIEAGQATRNRELLALKQQSAKLIERVNQLRQDNKLRVAVEVRHNEPFTVAPVRATPPARKPSGSGNGSGSQPPARQKILDKLLWLEDHGVYPAPKETLAAMCDVSSTSGGYFNNLGALRSAGLIEYPQPGLVGFTDAGRTEAQPSDDQRPVHEHWLGVVAGPQRAILAALIERHPDRISKNDLADVISVSPTSGGYFNNLGRLRTLGAIDYPSPGFVALTRHVMPES